MSEFYKNKPLYTKVWRKRTTGITGTDSVRACINNNRENYSMEVRYYKPEDHIADKAPAMLEKAIIEIELPKGKIWSGNISDLQEILLSYCK